LKLQKPILLNLRPTIRAIFFLLKFPLKFRLQINY
jgi:hypothetical protein